MPNVLVISNWWEKEDSFVNTCVLNGFNRRGVNTSFINLNDTSVREDKLFYNNQEVLEPDLAVFTNTVASYDSHKIDIIAKWNSLIINEPYSHMKSSNKWLVYNMLINAGIPIPKTMPYSYGFEATDESINNVFGTHLGWPFLLKTNYTGYGNGVTLCHNPVEVRAAADNNWSGPNWYDGTTYEPISAQEYVQSTVGMMISPWIQGDDIRCTLRIGDPNKEDKLKSDILPGRTRLPIKVDNELRDICMKTMEALNLEMARIDVVLTSEGYKICEVNAPGGFSAYDKPARGDIGQHMADYCLGRLASR